MYEKFLERFLYSNEMKKYLKGIHIEAWRVAEIIYKAPVCVEEKLAALKELESEYKEEKDHFYDSLVKKTSGIEEALEEKNKDGIYVFETFFFDHEKGDSGSSFEHLYVTYDEASNAAEGLYEYENKSVNDLVWYVITKWIKDENGKYIEGHKYYIVDHELRYISFGSRLLEYHEDMLDDHLYLPVPFKAGDIVKIDGSPFCSEFHAVIVEVGDNHDCCSLQGLARNKEGFWEVGAIKHGMIGVQSFPQMSMLYTIDYYDGELDDSEKILLAVSKYIDHNEENGIQLWNEVSVKEEISDSKLMEILDKLGVIETPEIRSDHKRDDGKYRFENFAIGNSNKMALYASFSVTESPGEIYNPLYIYGGHGLGKTHLLHAIENRIQETDPNKKVIYVTAEEFTNDVIEAIRSGVVSAMQELRAKYRTADVLLVDDIDFIFGKESTQEEFIHIFDILYDKNKQIVLSSEKLPGEYGNIEERFLSRFSCGLTIEIKKPDYEDRMGILKEKAKEMDIVFSDEILNFFARDCDSDVRELEGLIKRMAAYTKINDWYPSIADAHEVLYEVSKNKNHKEYLRSLGIIK